MSVTRRELLLAEFEKWGYDERGWSPRTRNKYATRVRALERWLQAEKHKSVLWATTKDLKAWLFSAPPCATTRNNYRQAVVAFYAFLMDKGYVDANHALALPRLKQPKPLPKALSPGQAFAIEQAARLRPQEEELLILVYLYLAIRATAGRTLEWRNLDLIDGYVRFVAKGGNEKSLPIPPRLLAKLREWRDVCPSARWVFPSPYTRTRDKPRSHGWVRCVMVRVGDAASLPQLHAHMLRHTWATRALQRGVDVRVVQEVLGHESLSSTQIYLHAAPKNLRAAIDEQDYRPEE